MRIFATFFENRFAVGMVPCNTEADGVCQRLPNNTARTVFTRNTSNINLNLSSLNGPVAIRAVDTQRAYSEVAMGTFDATNVTVNLPYNSDWALSIGWETSASTAPPAPAPGPTPAPPANDTVAPEQVENLGVSGLESGL